MNQTFNGGIWLFSSTIRYTWHPHGICRSTGNGAHLVHSSQDQFLSSRNEYCHELLQHDISNIRNTQPSQQIEKLSKTRPLPMPAIYLSSAHSFSFLICASSSGLPLEPPLDWAYVKSLVMLNVFLISSGDLPLIMFATVLQPVSRSGLISK